MTYRNYYKIEPTPRIREILLEAISRPFYQHFYDENNSEDFVCHFEWELEGPGHVREVDIFYGEGETAGDDHGDDEGFEVLVFY